MMNTISLLRHPRICPDLYCRILAAYNFVAENLNSTVITHQLQAANALYAISQIPELKFAAKTAEFHQSFSEKIFCDGQSHMLNVDGKSLTIWNALYALIELRTQNNPRLCDTLIRCVEANRIKPDLLNDEDKVATSTGEGFVLLALLSAYYQTLNNDYLISAGSCAEVILKHAPEIDPTTALGMYVLFKATDDPRYMRKLNKILKSTSRVKTDSITSLIAGLAQQVLTFADETEVTKNDVLARQKACQIYKVQHKDVGGFSIRPGEDLVRLDFAVENLLGYVQYVTQNRLLYAPPALSIQIDVNEPTFTEMR